MSTEQSPNPDGRATESAPVEATDADRAEQRTDAIGDGQETIGASSPQDSGLEKDPEDWVSGDDPMTPAQRSYLDTLARSAGEELPADLTKAEASEHIDRLKGEQQS